MCLYNTLVKNRKYTKNKKNGGVVPPLVDRRIEWIPVGCGNCIECRKQKANEWRVRLLEDIKTNINGKFITLTFSNESIAKLLTHEIQKKDGIQNYNEWVQGKEQRQVKKYKISDLTGYERDNAIATKAVRLFLERWRSKYGKSLRHWLITELGHKGTENIHLHGIVWTNEPIEEVEKIWGSGKPFIDKITGEENCFGGFMWKGYNKGGKIENYVNGKTVNYIIKYVTKRDEKHKEYRAKILTSAGIGANYMNSTNVKRNEYKDRLTEETYKTSTGHDIALPIYWRNKIYTDIEKERLWIQKLEKQVRWVCGEKIDVSNIKGEETYKKTVQWYRRINAELGYGGKPNDDRKKYEEQTRELMLQTRMRNVKKGVCDT